MLGTDTYAGPTQVPTSPPTEKPDTEQSVLSAVSKWQSAIHAAKAKWDPDFERMKKNMRFAAGWQWPDQPELDDDRYIANITLQMVNQKVATLYARNPTVIFKKRDRLYYELWDGRIETLATAVQRLQQFGPQDIESAAVVQDYQNGNRVKELLDKVGQTLIVLYNWQMDALEPDIKEQFKQLVRRVIITGVGYVKQSFVREDQEDLVTTTETNTSMVRRFKRAKMLMQQLAQGDFTFDDPRVEELKDLMASVRTEADEAYGDVVERLVLDFPASNSLIPSPECKNLKGFVGARWVAEEHLMTIDEMNAHFGTDVQMSSVTALYNEKGEERELHDFRAMENQATPVPRVCVWELYDLTTKCYSFLCDGYKDYLQEPTPVEPCTKHFWPWFSLTFNDVEAGEDARVSPFPPSDVQLMSSPQKEWNRTRQELRTHRKANIPKTVVSKGSFSEEDKQRLMTAPSCAVIEMEQLATGEKITDKMQPVPKHPIDPACYDTQPLLQDTLMTTGQQEANFGATQTQPGAGETTATAASIAEQSRISKSASNVDDLNGLLCELAKNGGELLMYQMSPNTVKRICGPGTVWPEADRQDYVNYIYLEVEAESSGRPNKATDVANFERMAPLLMQLGVNPQFLVREGVKRMDDSLDIAQAFPLIPPQNTAPSDPLMPASGPVSPNGPGTQIPQGPPQQTLPNRQPVSSSVQTQY